MEFFQLPSLGIGCPSPSTHSRHLRSNRVHSFRSCASSAARRSTTVVIACAH